MPNRWANLLKNNSKGCGGVMCVASVGLFADHYGAFHLGCETAALTHGHLSGYLSVGFVGLLIEEIVSGALFPNSIRRRSGVW